MTERRSVYIVDDEPLIRRSIARSLGEAGYSCRSFSEGADFIDALEYLSPGCVLLDVQMPGIDGIQVQNVLLERRADMVIVFMSGHGSIPLAVSVIKKGAFDFVVKPFSDGKLIRIVAAAHERLDEIASANRRKAHALNQLARLTTREKDILVHLLGGAPSKAVAVRLGISPRTVEMHRGSILRKIGVGSFAAVLQIGFDAGLTPVGGSTARP